jgi:hypothetical protein
MDKLPGLIVNTFMALAGLLIFAYAGYWWALDRPAWHIGWCPICVGWSAGADAQLAAYAKAEKDAQARAARINTAEAKVTVQAQTHEAAAQARIVYVYRTLQAEIPHVLTPALDRSFPLSVGFVRVHDAAALGVSLASLPDPTGQPDDAASRVAPSDLGAVIAGNYGRCQADAEQLSALQQWIRDQTAANEKGASSETPSPLR